MSLKRIVEHFKNITGYLLYALELPEGADLSLGLKVAGLSIDINYKDIKLSQPDKLGEVELEYNFIVDNKPFEVGDFFIFLLKHNYARLFSTIYFHALQSRVEAKHGTPLEDMEIEHLNQYLSEELFMLFREIDKMEHNTTTVKGGGEGEMTPPSTRKGWIPPPPIKVEGEEEKERERFKRGETGSAEEEMKTKEVMPPTKVEGGDDEPDEGEEEEEEKKIEKEAEADVDEEGGIDSEGKGKGKSKGGKGKGSSGEVDEIEDIDLEEMEQEIEEMEQEMEDLIESLEQESEAGAGASLSRILDNLPELPDDIKDRLRDALEKRKKDIAEKEGKEAERREINSKIEEMEKGELDKVGSEELLDSRIQSLKKKLEEGGLSEEDRDLYEDLLDYAEGLASNGLPKEKVNRILDGLAGLKDNEDIDDVLGDVLDDASDLVDKALDDDDVNALVSRLENAGRKLDRDQDVSDRLDGIVNELREKIRGLESSEIERLARKVQGQIEKELESDDHEKIADAIDRLAEIGTIANDFDANREIMEKIEARLAELDKVIEENVHLIEDDPDLEKMFLLDEKTHDTFFERARNAADRLRLKSRLIKKINVQKSIEEVKGIELLEVLPVPCGTDKLLDALENVGFTIKWIDKEDDGVDILAEKEGKTFYFSYNEDNCVLTERERGKIKDLKTL